ncbi:MAG: hypothetical protein KBB39_12055 [Phycicoccus sp.]|nr:hypothetical protein [Phycicoccus sp.]
MADTPFFAPLPEPTHEPETLSIPPVFPGQPAWNVDHRVVALNLDVARTDNLLLRLTHVEAQRGGLLFVLHWWQSPSVADPQEPWRAAELEQPRLGVVLADGSRLGVDVTVRPDPFEPGPALAAAAGQWGGETGWVGRWLYPLPAGDDLEVVVAWTSKGVQETWLHVDLKPLVSAAAETQELWPAPVLPAGDHGWFAYAPMSGESLAFGLPGTAGLTVQQDQTPGD